MSLTADSTTGSPPVAARRFAGARWLNASAVVFALIFLLRIAMAAFLPLTEDEAYYRLWAQHLAFGYYDHPPMIAWWVRTGMTLVGDNPLGVRLVSILSSAAISVLVFDLGRRLGGRAACGVRAALWYNATLTVGLGALLAAPDAPASLFWALTLWCLARIREDARWWVAAGAAAGFGVLSKYSALFLAPGALLWVLSSAERRTGLGRPWPWVGAGLAMVVASPNLVWNAQHHWLTFARQFGRVVPPGFAPGHLLQLLVLQTLLFGPVLIFYVWRAIAGRTPVPADGAALGEAGSGVALIVATSLPFLGYLLLHSLHSQVEEHWPVPLFAGGAVLAALGAKIWPGPRWLRSLPLAGLAAPIIVLVYVAWPTSPLKRDPAQPLEGWPAFSQRILEIQTARHAGWVATVSYGAVAQFAAATIHPAPVIQLDERERYQGWPIAGGLDQSRPGLVVDLDRRMDAALLYRCFRQVENLGVVGRGRPGASQAMYRLFLVEGPKFDLVDVGCPSRKNKRKRGQTS